MLPKYGLFWLFESFGHRDQSSCRTDVTSRGYPTGGRSGALEGVAAQCHRRYTLCWPQFSPCTRPAKMPSCHTTVAHRSISERLARKRGAGLQHACHVGSLRVCCSHRAGPKFQSGYCVRLSSDCTVSAPAPTKPSTFCAQHAANGEHLVSIGCAAECSEGRCTAECSKGRWPAAVTLP